MGAKGGGLLKIHWKTIKENDANLFTKSLLGPTFEKHTAVLCGQDEYNRNSGNI